MPQQYRPSRRSWIKLWTNEWMTGTIRWQLTREERSIWADLLCLAGLSRFPGIIASGYEGDENSPLMGYPIDWLAAQCGTIPDQVQNTLRKLEIQERLTITENGKSENGMQLFVVSIVNWEKYQSEYQVKRQRRQYSEAPRPDGDYKRHSKSSKCPPKTPTEEVEVEKRESREEKKKPPTKPVGEVSHKFIEIWNEERGGKLPAVIKATEQRIKACKDRSKSWNDEQVRSAIIKARTTPFLTGGNDRGWVATFDWFFKNDNNIARVMEGAFNGKSERNNRPVGAVPADTERKYKNPRVVSTV